MMLDLCRPSTAWHVVYTAPQAESTARNGIQAIGFDAYMPVERTTKIMRRRRVEVVRPLFSRYVFAGVGMGFDWQDLRGVDGVEDVLRNNDVPSRVPVAWIDRLRKLEEFGTFDRRKNGPTPFEIGEMVRMSEGPFAGLNARIEAFVAKLKSSTASKRAKVLFDFLGQQTRMEVDVVALEKV